MIYSHYSALMAEGFARSGPAEGEMEFLQKYLRKDAPNLDLACGTGRLLFPIKQLGYEIYGIDSSPEMLAQCRLKEEQFGFSVTTYQQFMQTFEIDVSFGLIFIADCSFDLLYTVEDQRTALQNIKRHLMPGGTLLFDIETVPDPAWMASGQMATWSSSDDGKTIMISRKIFRYDPVTHQRPGLQIHELYIDGELSRKQAYEDPMRFNDPKAVTDVLAEEGFLDISLGRYLSDEPPLNTVGELVSIRCKVPEKQEAAERYSLSGNK